MVRLRAPRTIHPIYAFGIARTVLDTAVELCAVNLEPITPTSISKEISNSECSLDCPYNAKCKDLGLWRNCVKSGDESPADLNWLLIWDPCESGEQIRNVAEKAENLWCQFGSVELVGEKHRPDSGHAFASSMVFALRLGSTHSFRVLRN